MSSFLPQKEVLHERRQIYTSLLEARRSLIDAEQQQAAAVRAEDYTAASKWAMIIVNINKELVHPAQAKLVECAQKQADLAILLCEVTAVVYCL